MCVFACVYIMCDCMYIREFSLLILPLLVFYLCLATSLAGKRLRNIAIIWLNHQTFKHVVTKLPTP